MSDFESGLATKVRLLPGEQSSTSEGISTSDGAGSEGSNCAPYGAQPFEKSPAERTAALTDRLAGAPDFQRTGPLHFLIGYARSAAAEGDYALLCALETAFACTLWDES